LPCQDFLCLFCVCFQHWRVFNSNNLGAHLGFYILSRKIPFLALPWGDVSCCLVPAAPRFGWGQQLSRSASELGLHNFLTMWVKQLWRRGPWWPHKFCAQTKTRNIMEVTK
jgi:hypothetical protein